MVFLAIPNLHHVKKIFVFWVAPNGIALYAFRCSAAAGGFEQNGGQGVGFSRLGPELSSKSTFYRCFYSMLFT
jgi:hypothetical protein